MNATETKQREIAKMKHDLETLPDRIFEAEMELAQEMKEKRYENNRNRHGSYNGHQSLELGNETV
jgi:hypothetical protein